MSCFLTNVEPYVHSTFIFPGLLPCNVPSVTLSPTAPDSKNEVLVGGSKPGSPTPLNVGETKVEVEVTSADGSNKQVRSAILESLLVYHPAAFNNTASYKFFSFITLFCLFLIYIHRWFTLH